MWQFPTSKMKNASLPSRLHARCGAQAEFVQWNLFARPCTSVVFGTLGFQGKEKSKEKGLSSLPQLQPRQSEKAAGWAR